MDSLIYLDNAATTAVKPEVFEQMMPYFMDTYSNPASVYSFAGKAKKAVDDAREQIANALNAKTPTEVYFTGGGSEADNWAIKMTAEAYQNKGKHIIRAVFLVFIPHISEIFIKSFFSTINIFTIFP